MSVVIHVYGELSLNGHLYKTDTSLRPTPGVGPFPSVTKLPIRRTPLKNGPLKPVPTVAVLERDYCNIA